MKSNYPGIIIKHRVLIIITVVILTLILGFGIKFLKINSDITSYLKPDDPVMILFNRIGEEYGGNLLVLVVIKADDVFTYPVLDLINKLEDSYLGINGVVNTTSIISTVDIKDTGYGIEIGKLIDKNNIPKSKEELSRIRNYVLSKDIYRGKIISPDGKTTLIICKLSQDANKVDVAKEIKNTSYKIIQRNKANIKIYFSGYPMEMAEMNRYLAVDLRNLIPIILVVIVIVLFLSFKTWRGVTLPLMIVVIATIWTMGVMGYTGTELSVVSNIIPVILLGLGTAYGIHFLAKYYEDITEEKYKFRDIDKTIRHIGIPILLTALTTIAGFLSFTGAYITAISAFGIFTAFGVLVSVILSLTFLPAVLAVLKVKHGAISSGKRHFLKSFMEIIAHFVVKKKKAIVIVTFLIFIAGAFAIPRIKTETSISDFFPKKSDIRKAESIIKNDFGGSTPLQIVIKGDIKNPYVLKKIDLLERYIDSLPEIYNPQSISDLICEMNRIVNGTKIIPETKEEVANLMFLLEGQKILEQMVNSDYTEAIVQATFNSPDSTVMHKTIKEIERYLSKNLNGSYMIIQSNNLNDEQKEWIIDHTAEIITSDIYNTAFIRVKKEKIKEYLLHHFDWNGFYLDEEQKQKLKDDIFTFFNEESEVIIESQRDIENEVDTLITYAENHRANLEEITELMYNTIPDVWWKDDPESVKASAVFIYNKIFNSQTKSYTLLSTKKLLEYVFGNKRAKEFKNKTVIKIQEDIYYLSYKSYSVPVNIAGNTKVNNNAQNIVISSTLSGMLKILERLDISLIKSQIQSVIIATVVVFLILSLQFKSFKVGLIVLSPIVFVILLNFSIMGYAGIPLDYATMLVGSILIGVGIDYSIHFSSRFKSEILLSNNDEMNLTKTLTTTGVAIIVNALMVALGFLVLVAGKLSIIRREGWMISVLMIISAFAAVVYLPSIFLLLKNKLNYYKKQEDKNEDSA